MLVETDTNKIRISITLDPAVHAQLPYGENKSAFINQVLKQYFQAEHVDKLYTVIKQRLIQEFDIKERIFNEEGVEMVRTPYGLQEKTYD